MYGKREREKKKPMNICYLADVHRDRKKYLFEEIVSIRYPYQNPAYLYIVIRSFQYRSSTQSSFPASMAGS